MQLKSFQFIDWNLFIYFLSTLGTKSISMKILDRVLFQLKVIFGHTRRPFAEKVPLTQCSKKVTPANRKSFTLHPSGFNFTRNLIRLPRMASHQGVGGRLLQHNASDKVFLAIKKKRSRVLMALLMLFEKRIKSEAEKKPNLTHHFSFLI